MKLHDLNVTHYKKPVGRRRRKATRKSKQKTARLSRRRNR